MSQFNPCFLIPCYNHGNTIHAVVDQLIERFSLPVIVIDDGSQAETQVVIDALGTKVEIIRLEQNQGKGGAVIAGLKRAQQLGFTHALQVDADGQHDLASCSKLIEESKTYPEALVSGRPIYDESVPKGRLYGRYLTHTCVWLETLSFEIKDSMCGFRSYPVERLNEVIAKQHLGKRMDFDTEVMVKCFWDDVEIRFITTKVIYPENGISHFQPFADNVRISKMHTLLILGMLLRIPSLLTRKKRLQKSLQHWSKQTESGTYYGIKCLLFIYSLFGRRVFKWCLKPVMYYYSLFAKNSIAASQEYLYHLKHYSAEHDIPLPKKLTVNQHLSSFAETILDKLAAWKGDFSVKDLTIHNQDHISEAQNQPRGCVILGSHLGNLELFRALSLRHQDLTINALVFTEHAPRFNAVMQAVNPDSSVNVIQVNKIGPDTAIMLDQKIDAGEWVVIVGDRTSTSVENKVVWADFLGKPAPFPQGPFLLASILKAPVYLLFGLRDDSKKEAHFDLHFEPFSEQILLPRHNREQALQDVVTQYAKRLQFYTLKAPLQWYNFFDFWKLTGKSNDK
ncbi:glycosyltransferase family 2 protein [Psychromonas sp. RZ22]|uniref:glycosyltransferase family 2 protein n=1 Tax=Psychromonas algarum TaxID=2555643 RepID=UPI00106885CC|nr:glycosyltransferase family 2 protein [Psychromonas sp. RZ22]TEW54086.1 glycosyltransferase family 2 protein [Psychromonas sp. RZ22]